jgi:carbonic anhydrase
MNAIKNLIRGNKLFRKYHYSDFEEESNELIIHGQKPQALFIGCCDSRVTPDLMMGAKPGDLFVLRNIGNFVPPYDSKNNFPGFTSAIEYALLVLKVSNIIVCGHSHCGACQSLHTKIPDDDNLKNIKSWLEIGEKAKDITLKKSYQTKEELYRATEKNSLICQLENLMTYPLIQEQVKNNNLKLHGWYYNLTNGFIEFYDKKSQSFRDIIEYED